MIEVPIDKIIPIEEALGDIEKIINSAGEKDNLYVLTKNGKPYAAIVNIDYLEHLPEIEHAGETKPIHEIGKEEKKEEKPEEKSEEPKTESETKNNSNEKDSNDLYDENIGPWNKQNQDKNTPDTGNNLSEPPDLPLD